MAKPKLPLDTVKTHLRIEHDLDDPLLEVLAAAAVDRALAEIGLAEVLGDAVWEEMVRADADGVLRLTAPVEDAETLTVAWGSNAAGWTELEEVDFTVRSFGETGWRVIVANACAGTVYKVSYVAGFGETMPSWFAVACLFLTANFYENRSSVAVGQGISAVEIPQSALFLLGPHKRIHFA